MNKTAFLVSAGFLFAVALVLVIVIGRAMLRAELNVTPAPQAVALSTAPHAVAAATTKDSSGSEAAKSGTLFQYAKWGMSPEELLAFGKGNIVKASPSEINPYNQGRSAGTTMAIDAADAVLTSRYNAEGITYDVLYYFNSRGLFLVALISKSVEDGLKTSKLLDATYGAPDREDRMGINEDYTGCVVRRRWRAPRGGNLVTFFNLCGTRFEVRYEPLPAL